jgi:hypothetical protein
MTQDTDRRQLNREAQARYRERHLGKRRAVQRVANILMRKTWTGKHFDELGVLLRSIMNRPALRALRRQLREPTDAEMDAIWWQREKNTRVVWLTEHPGRTAAEFNRLFRDDDSEVWDWLRAKGAAQNAAEREAWLRDHPGEEYPEHLCGLSDREYTDYQRWLRKRERSAAKAR